MLYDVSLMSDQCLRDCSLGMGGVGSQLGILTSSLFFTASPGALCRLQSCVGTLQQDVEKVLQRRSRLVQRLNVRQRVRFASSLAAALPAERRVLARRGWASEKKAFLNILLADPRQLLSR